MSIAFVIPKINKRRFVNINTFFKNSKLFQRTKLCVPGFPRSFHRVVSSLHFNMSCYSTFWALCQEFKLWILGIFTSCSDIFSHIVAHLEPCVILAYSEPCHIQYSGIFRTQDMFRTLLRHILAYSLGCVKLASWKPCQNQNFVIFRISASLGLEAYSKSCLFRHI